MITNKKFDWVIALVTFLVSMAVMTAGILLYQLIAPTGVILRAVYVGALCMLTLLASFGFASLINSFRGAARAELPPLLSVLTIVLLIVSFLLGGLGETLYTLQFTADKVKIGEKEEKEVVEYSENADIILLIDDSGSLEKMNLAVRKATSTFIDGLSDECSVGGAVFADMLYEYQDIVKMDDAGRTQLKNSLSVNAGGGGTNFNPPLEWAARVLRSQNHPDRHHAVVMFSDGCEIDSYPFSQAIASKYLDSSYPIEFYMIRPTEDFYGIKDVLVSGIRTKYEYKCSDGLLDLVRRSGGIDSRVIATDNQGYADMNDILEVLNQMSQRTEEKVVVKPIYETRYQPGFNNGLILYDNTHPVTIWRIIIRAGFFLLLAFVAQLLYHRKFKLITLILTLCSLAVSALTTLAGIIGIFPIASLAIALGIGTVFTMIVERIAYDSYAGGLRR